MEGRSGATKGKGIIWRLAAMRNIMNINKIPPHSTDAIQDPNATTSKPNEEDKAGVVMDQGVSSDRVVLSKDYQQLAQTKKVTMSRDEVRTDKVDLIRSQLAEGTYQINPEGIAKKMLEEMI
jgi:flagellar biosynthesis anti-sigma factor FlgM